jgi:hypothetical protein
MSSTTCCCAQHSLLAHARCHCQCLLPGMQPSRPCCWKHASRRLDMYLGMSTCHTKAHTAQPQWAPHKAQAPWLVQWCRPATGSKCTLGAATLSRYTHSPGLKCKYNTGSNGSSGGSRCTHPHDPFTCCASCALRQPAALAVPVSLSLSKQVVAVDGRHPRHSCQKHVIP